MGRRHSVIECQKPDREGGPLVEAALPDGRASDTNANDSPQILCTAGSVHVRRQVCHVERGRNSTPA